MAKRPTGMPPKKKLLQKEPDKNSELYKDFVYNGMKLIHDPQTRDSVLNMLSPENPVATVAEATLNIVKMLETDAQQEIPVDVKAHGANEIMGQIIEIGEMSGKIQPPLTEEQRKEAFGQAVGKYTQQGVAEGTIDQSQLVQAGQQFQQSGVTQ